MRLDGHQLDRLVLHQAGLAAHLCLRPAKLRGVRQAANEHWRARCVLRDAILDLLEVELGGAFSVCRRLGLQRADAAEAPAHWLGVALSEDGQWLLDKFWTGSSPTFTPRKLDDRSYTRLCTL